MEYRTIELDFRTVTVKDNFNENDNVKEAYFNSVTIGEWIKRFEDDLTDELSNMTIGELKQKLNEGDKHENYWNLFRDIDTEVRVWLIYLTLTIEN